MVANSIQKRVAVALESGSLSAPATIDYDAIASPGGLLAVTQVDDAALRRARIDDKRIPSRASDNPGKLQALRNEAAATLGMYVSGQTSGHAAAAVQAARDLIDMVIRASWGGENRGYSADITGGSAAAPEVTATHGDNIDEYTWGYFWDTSESVGYFRQIASATTDTLTMADDHDLPFTPAAGDRMYAVIAHYVDWDIAEDHTDSGSEMLRVLLSGRQSDDLYELYGAKPELQFGAIEQGTRTEITMPMKCAYFLHDELAITPSLAQALTGSPGQTVGAGTTTRAYLTNLGTDLTSQQFWGGINFTAGVVPEQLRGPNGTEGVHGYGVTEDSYKASQLELAVPFDPQFRTDAEVDTPKRFMVQVGNAITAGPWALYCPRLSWMDDPEPGAEGNARRQNTLRFMVNEARDDGSTGAVDTTGLSDAAVHRARAKFMLLRVA